MLVSFPSHCWTSFLEAQASDLRLLSCKAFLSQPWVSHAGHQCPALLLPLPDAASFYKRKDTFEPDEFGLVIGPVGSVQCGSDLWKVWWIWHHLWGSVACLKTSSEKRSGFQTFHLLWASRKGHPRLAWDPGLIFKLFKSCCDWRLKSGTKPWKPKRELAPDSGLGSFSLLYRDSGTDGPGRWYFSHWHRTLWKSSLKLFVLLRINTISKMREKCPVAGRRGGDDLGTKGKGSGGSWMQSPFVGFHRKEASIGISRPRPENIFHPRFLKNQKAAWKSISLTHPETFPEK